MKIKSTLFLIFFFLFSYSQKVENLTRYEENNKFGIKDSTKNKIVIPAGKYEFLNPIDEEGMILGKQKGKWGFINSKEEIIIPFIYDDLSVFSKNGLVPATLNGKSGFINRKGQTIIPFIYDGTGWFYDLGLSSVYNNNKGGFINENGKIIIPIIYDKVDYNKVDKIVRVQKNNKWAFYSNDGIKLSDFIFDKITENQIKDRYYTVFENGLGLVYKNKKCGYINKQIQTIVPYGKYNECNNFETNKLAIVKKRNKFSIINEKGTEIKTKFDSLIYEQPFYITKISNNFGVLDSLGNDFLPARYKEIESIRFEVLKNYINFLKLQTFENKFGILDSKKEEIVPIIYDSIDQPELSNYGNLLIVRLNNKFGVIDYKNKIVIPIQYDEIESGRWIDYFIAKKNNTEILFEKNGSIKTEK